jgi:phospholipid/cholesterol/gamma-HCH transport system ATP-binding protein
MPLTRDTPRETIIEVRNLVKRYGDNVVHDGLNLDVYRGEVLSIVGGSGTGKTVLLRQIVGWTGPPRARSGVRREPAELTAASCRPCATAGGCSSSAARCSRRCR